jgi:aminoglycoside 3-N-acetyltransferase
MAADDGMTRSPGAGVTREQLAGDLISLGVKPDDTLLVHSSLRAVGWVAGGARTVVEALREVVGPAGNIVVPASTEANSKTSRAHRERIATMTSAQARQYRQTMPAFDPRTTPSGAGAIAEALRQTAGAVRSDHPQSSFAAIGPEAEYLMADHRLESHLGEDSPLAKLYKQQHARVLLLGVGYHACTAFHLAEYRYTASPPRRTYACVIATNGRRRWTAYPDVVLDDHEFEVIGQSLEKEVTVVRGNVGNAECRLMSLPAAVDFAANWMARYRA